MPNNFRFFKTCEKCGLAIINANFEQDLQAASVTPTNFDMFTEEFTADGTGIDAFLDKYTVEIDSTTTSYTVMNTETNSTVTIDETVDVSNYYIGALFAFDESYNWTLSTSIVVNGQTQVIFDGLPIQAATVPYNRSRFLELGWGDILDFSESNSTGEGYSFTIQSYSPTYNISGDGEIGTTITASSNITYSITTPQGTTSGSYVWSFEYKRVS